MARVLIVDEDEAHGMQLAERLQASGHQVLSCTGGQKAIRILEESEEPFELVILDLSQSPQEGLECVREISDLHFKLGRFPGPLVLCVSANYFEPRFELEVEACGARVVYEG